MNGHGQEPRVHLPEACVFSKKSASVSINVIENKAVQITLICIYLKRLILMMVTGFKFDNGILETTLSRS